MMIVDYDIPKSGLAIVFGELILSEVFSAV